MRSRASAALLRLVVAGEAALSSGAPAARVVSSSVARAAAPAAAARLSSALHSAAGPTPPAAGAAAAAASSSSSRGFATAPPANAGAQLAQKVLSADPAAVDPQITELVRDVGAQALSAVARAALVTGITDKAFLDALAEGAVKAMPELLPGDVCSIAEDFSELGCYNIAFKDALADHMLERLSEFDGDMLGKTLRAFGSMRYYDDDLLEGVVTYVHDNPQKFSSENIADVVYAFSKCGFCHPDLISVVETAADRLLSEPIAEGGKAIADILDAYSRVGCSSPESVDDLVERLPQHTQHFDPEHLAKVTVATIRLGYDDEHLLLPMLDAARGHLDTLSPKSIVKLVRVLGELGFAHRPLLDALTDETIPARLPEFHNAGLDDVVHSLNKLGYYNSEFMALMKQVEEQRAGQAVTTGQ